MILCKLTPQIVDMDMEGNTPLFYTAGQSNEGGSGIATTLLLSDADTRVKNNQGFFLFFTCFLKLEGIGQINRLDGGELWEKNERKEEDLL